MRNKKNGFPTHTLIWRPARKIKHALTLCMLGNHDFLLSADSFSKSTFWKNSFENTIRVSNSLDPDWARLFVGPDLGPNCLPLRLSADDKSRGWHGMS